MMELAHEGEMETVAILIQGSFNPCYDGIGSRREPKAKVKQKSFTRFNPCYDGIGSRRLLLETGQKEKCLVSILVMMELAHEVQPVPR